MTEWDDAVARGEAIAKQMDEKDGAADRDMEDLADAIEQERIRRRVSTEDVTMAEEPIEDRLRRAWLNGFKEGVDRAAQSIEGWGRWDS